MKRRQSGCMLTPLVVLTMAAFAGTAAAQQATIKIGLIAPLEGALALSGQDAIRGTELALDEIKYMIGNKKIVVLKESSNGRPDVALGKAKKLIEQDNVDILIGPLAGGEGLAIKEYAKTQPNKTFVQGTSAAQELTLKDAAPNLYRFTGEGAQWQAGLGNYAYDVKGYRNIVSVGDDYAFPSSQVAGFISEFCPKGGRIAQRFWAPLGTKDYNSIIAKIPDNIDAIYLLVAGADAVNFLTQYQQAGGKKPIISGTAGTSDSSVSSEAVRVAISFGVAASDCFSDFTASASALTGKSPFMRRSNSARCAGSSAASFLLQAACASVERAPAARHALRMSAGM